MVYFYFPTKAQYVLFFPPCMLQPRPSLPPSQTVRRILQWISQTTAHRLAVQCTVHSAQQGTCQRLQTFRPPRPHFKAAFVRAVCSSRTVRSFTTKRKITVGERLLPFWTELLPSCLLRIRTLNHTGSVTPSLCPATFTCWELQENPQTHVEFGGGHPKKNYTHDREGTRVGSSELPVTWSAVGAGSATEEC